MPSDFYRTFAPMTFTILGLWMLVVQVRHAEWMADEARRRRAYGISLHFGLPGLMSLLSLVDPSSKGLWRVAFGGLGVLGAVAAPVLGRRWWAWVAAALYALIASVAIAPGWPEDAGLNLPGLRMEALLLSLLVMFAIAVAWVLMFEPGDSS